MKYTVTIIDYRGIWKVEFRNNNLDFICQRKHFIINYSNIVVKVIYKIDNKIDEATFFINDEFMFSSLNNIKQILIGNRDITMLWKLKLQLNANLLDEQIII